MKLLFATQNGHKLQEVQSMLGGEFKLIGLNDVRFSGELQEDQSTLEGNAYQKSVFVYEKFGYNCFADDTGLEIDALDGLPGVNSARYAGEGKDANDNIKKVLQEMKGVTNRKARFRTVISLIIDDEERQFEGIVEGDILTEKKGEQGFGYDPIFQPKGYNRSFAELSLNEKNKISHRGIAFRKLVDYLNNKRDA